MLKNERPFCFGRRAMRRSLPQLLFLLTSLLWLTTLARAQSGGIEINANTPWIVSNDEPEPVKRAMEDVQDDWYKVFGHPPVLLTELPANWKGPVIYMGLNGPVKRFAGGLSGRESFTLRLQNGENGANALVATGADTRGAIYAAYALSEYILGVDPWYYWVDKEPARRNSISVAAGFSKSFGSPTFKYRGWFINDEDLSNTFSPDPLRENVFSLDWFDRIYETILRLRGNMVVPATFLFPDERCQELAARRGLVLNMHHILVLGLNTYRWPANVPFSYNKNPKAMEKYWQTCIDAFKDYETVWTVGYRGKHDRPFWSDEPELKTPESRGKVITDAIAKQVEMIRKVHPDAPIIANMWMEGADLYHQGLIKLPKGVTLVWPDGGQGIIRDDGHVAAGQGIYYHTAMLSGQHNQLSEMVNPARIYNQIGRFVKAGATEFFLVNVSDVRPVPLSTDCVMKMVWDARPYLGKSDAENMDAFLKDWCNREFGSDLAAPMAALYKDYFMIPYMRDDVLKGENTIHSRIRQVNALVTPLIAENKSWGGDVIARVKEELNFAATHASYVSDLLDRALLVIPQLPADRVDFYRGHLITQLKIHLQSLRTLEWYCKAALAFQQGKKDHAIADAEETLRASEHLFSAIQDAEYGKWAGWYHGECFVNINGSYDIARVLVARLKGEPIPPVRKERRYEALYDYQLPFEKNFPLLYPHK